MSGSHSSGQPNLHPDWTKADEMELELVSSESPNYNFKFFLNGCKTMQICLNQIPPHDGSLYRADSENITTTAL